MDLGSLFLILALLVLVGIFISRPLFENQEAAPEFPTSNDDHERSALLAERDRILNALQELDFDHALGKIPEEDYPGQRAYLLQRGADTLRKLDSFQADDSLEQEEVEARIEAAIAARRAERVPVARGVSSSVASPDDELEVMLANRRRARGDKAAGFCPQCGGPMQKSDRFCPRCGNKVN
jgi:rubrerythrin